MGILDEKTHLFIDGESLNSTLRGTGKRVDFEKLLTFFEEICQVGRVNYYALMHHDSPEHSKLFLNSLKKISFKTHVYIGSEAVNIGNYKQNLNAAIAADLGLICDKISQIVIISGDPVIVHAIRRIRSTAAKICVLNCNPKHNPLFMNNTDFCVDAFEFLRDCITETAVVSDEMETKK